MEKADCLKHRKSSVVIAVQRPDGSPVSKREVEIRQTGHSFLFGCGAFETLNITDSDSGPEKRAFYEERMEKWLKLFNYATLPFYWGQFEASEGNTNTEAVRRAALWLKERGVILKGHPLCWHTQTAPWLLELTNQDILEKQLARIRREVTEFKGLIDMWDVINEVVIMPVFDKYDNGITRICKELGRVQLVSDVFGEARRSNPGAVLLLNDFNTSPKYEELIEACLEAGVSIDAIGIQSHQHQGYWGKEKLLEVLARFSRFGLPVHFTENTFISGHLMPPDITDLNDYQIKEWPTTEEGEARQAENVEEFYRILFADPHVEAITTWAFQDGAWLGAPAGLVRTDNSEKPAYGALRHLIREEWNTSEVKSTDELGRVELYGFNGRYEAMIDGVVKKFEIRKQEEGGKQEDVRRQEEIVITLN